MTTGSIGSCQLCRSRDLADVLDFGPQPISNRFRPTPEAPEAKFPLALVQCRTCGLTQLRQPPPASELVPPYSWLSYNEPEGHLDRLAESIVALHGLEPGAMVWGLSFKDDTLLRRLNERGFKSYRLDPAIDLGIDAPGAGVESIQDRLRPQRVPQLLANRQRPQVIIARHILEHVHDLHAFVSTMKSLLAPGGFLMLEVPDCEPAFRLLDYTIVWEEHVAYFTPATLPPVFDIAGMQMLSQKVLPLGHESVLVAIGRVMQQNDAADVRPATQADRALVAAFSRSFESVRQRFADALAEHNQRREKVAILGAGHLACAFVNYLRLHDRVSFVVDDNPNKQGLFLPGSRLSIRGSAALIEENAKLCLLSVNPEVEQKVIDRNRAFVDRGGRFASIFTASQRALVRI